MDNLILSPQHSFLGALGAFRREEEHPQQAPQRVLQEVNEYKTVIDLVAGYDNPYEGWESLQVRELIRNETEEWIFGLADWKSMLSLTFKDERTPDVANSLFKWFVRENNKHLIGKHYSQKVGHSYFSYVLGMEYQTRDVVHFHALVDKPLDFSFVHRTWGGRCGFVWIDGNIRSRAQAVNYVCKYCVKGGQIEVYKAKGDYIPPKLPYWWNVCENPLSRAVQDPLPCGPEPLAKPLTGLQPA